MLVMGSRDRQIPRVSLVYSVSFRFSEWLCLNKNKKDGTQGMIQLEVVSRPLHACIPMQKCTSHP